MNFTVVWLDAALAQLARHYVPLWGTPQGAAITAAMARVDTLLETNPAERGESRAGHGRILIELPISIDFEVHPDRQAVVVTQARYHPPRVR